jgi:hypothetical protein
MSLLTEELRALLPPLYAQEGDENPMVYAKFVTSVTPDSSWIWYVTEGSHREDDFVFFGYVVGFEAEWGYFALSELESSCGPCGDHVHHDPRFTPRRLNEIEDANK